MATVEDVKKKYRLSAKETLIDRKTCTDFRIFLEKKKSGDESETQKSLKIYQKCDDYINNKKRITKQEVEDLGLEFCEEVELKEEVETGDPIECLRLIKERYCKKIEFSNEYISFKDDKLK